MPEIASILQPVDSVSLYFLTNFYLTSTRLMLHLNLYIP